MPSFESIVVVEDWISEHYFTTEGKGVTFQKHVLDLRKQWTAQAESGQDTVLQRFRAGRRDLESSLAALGELDEPDANEQSRHAYAQLRQILGFKGKPEARHLERGAKDVEVDGLWLGDAADVLWIEGTPVASGDGNLSEARILGTYSVDGKAQDQPLAKIVSELYQCENPPSYIVVSSGSWLVLTDRERWPEGRYLSADVQLIAERNDTSRGGEADRFLAIFGRQSLMPTAEGTIWWDERLAESRQHAVGVSKDLRDGIRESIEIIANEVLDRRRDQGMGNDGIDGQELARQSLRFLYRILFLLYAEASPELGVLPKGAGEYDAGYGLDRLRELVQVDLPSQRAQHGTHLYESLNLLFNLVNGDHAVQRRAARTPEHQDDEFGSRAEGLVFEPLKADLFASAATALIGEVGLGNAQLQRVLERLLLSKSNAKGERGFISYANLGINQLGAVYEGLMSYTGFIAQEDLREVAKNGDASKGSWVVPVTRLDGIDAKHFVRRPDENGILTPVHHRAGSFVFRLAGRERQQSASYYTPEVLTKFVVSQALEELLGEDTTAQQILELSICEPALGSGAFAIEAVRQLAEEYLARRQRELDTTIPADEVPGELQKVKAQIALHQVHGVDLNSTAVELAEVSLWLDTMQPGLSAPWFGLRLKRGNSLIGASRATYSLEAVKAKRHLTEAPQAHPLTGLAAALENETTDPAVLGGIHHFLLPAEGWGAAAGAKEVKDLAADEQKKLKDWARSTRIALKKPQLNRLQALAERVEVLWKIVLRRLRIAESEVRRTIDYWGKTASETAGTITRAQIEQMLADPNGAYQRLTRVMNAWNALWFWPLTETEVSPPSVDEWIAGLEGILGIPIPESKRSKAKFGNVQGQTTVLSSASWNDLSMVEAFDFPLAHMEDAQVLGERYPWLIVCDRVAEEQGFFHWELDFASVFARGGFDLQVGNPPWVRPDWDEKSVFAEYDPWWQIEDKTTQGEQALRKQIALADEVQVDFMKSMAGDLLGTRSFLTSNANYPVVSELRPDLYRSFMERTWNHGSAAGIVSLIHPESHFTEKKAQHLRSATYRRMRRHWQFINELSLFEIDHHVSYGVHIYGAPQEKPQFQMAASLYHPETVARSLVHEGGTEVPGLKTAEGKWDTRPHPERIVNVDLDVLSVWADILDEPGTSPLHARMVYPVNRASMTVLEKLSKAPRVRELGLQYSSGWNETTDRKKGYFEVGSKVNDSWDDVILQGPHFTVANPFAKQPNPTMKNNLDWTELDLEALPADFIPRTSLQPVRANGLEYDRAYGQWLNVEGNLVSPTNQYRLAWRKMASITGSRTLHATLIPPNAYHSEGTRSAYSFDFCNELSLPGLAGQWASLLLDFFVRTSGSANLTPSVVENLPVVKNSVLNAAIARRMITLTALTSAFENIWNENLQAFWKLEAPKRKAVERRQSLVELDVLVAIGLNISAEELCTIYRTQFPVLRGYEQNDLYDVNGRKVPSEMNKLYRKVGEDGMSLADRQWTHPQSGVGYTFEFPFRSFDREEDMRAAYEKFSTMLREHGEIIEEGQVVNG